MPSLTFSCPRTGRRVGCHIDFDPARQPKPEEINIIVQCPHCKTEHWFKLSDAFEGR